LSNESTDKADSHSANPRPPPHETRSSAHEPANRSPNISKGKLNKNWMSDLKTYL